MKKRKAILATVIIAAVACAGVGGAWAYMSSAGRAVVDVYGMEDIGMSDGYNSETYSDGYVQADKMQSVYLSDTQSVTEIFVTQGQSVKAGDKLMSYDTTISELELKKKNVEVQKKELEVKKAQEELKEIKTYKAGEPIDDPVSTGEALGAADSDSAGKIETASADMATYALGTGEAQTDGVVSASAVTSVRVIKLSDTGSSAGEEPTVEMLEKQIEELQKQLSELQAKSDAKDETIAKYEAQIKSLQEELAGYKGSDNGGDSGDGGDDGDDGGDDGGDSGGDTGTVYTAAEIAALKSAKEQEIKQAQTELKLLEVEYKTMESELGDGFVYSTYDGTVKTLTDEQTARADGTPLMVVSSGGGYYISATVGEFQRDELSVGDSVRVYFWENDEQLTGTIGEISDVPQTDGNSYYYEGNSNVSRYPVKVYIDESANISENSYAEIYFGSSSGGSDTIDGSDSGSLYVLTSFVRKEDDESWCMVQGEDGKLEKREVTTGALLYGEYIEVKSGLTMEDRLAFPYGKDVKEGAGTQDGDISEFYNSMYS